MRAVECVPVTVVELDGGGQMVRSVVGAPPRSDAFDDQMGYLEQSVARKPETAAQFIARKKREEQL